MMMILVVEINKIHCVYTVDARKTLKEDQKHGTFRYKARGLLAINLNRYFCHTVCVQ